MSREWQPSASQIQLSYVEANFGCLNPTATNVATCDGLPFDTDTRYIFTVYDAAYAGDQSAVRGNEPVYMVGEEFPAAAREQALQLLMEGICEEQGVPKENQATYLGYAKEFSASLKELQNTKAPNADIIQKFKKKVKKEKYKLGHPSLVPDPENKGEYNKRDDVVLVAGECWVEEGSLKIIRKSGRYFRDADDAIAGDTLDGFMSVLRDRFVIPIEVILEDTSPQACWDKIQHKGEGMLDFYMAAVKSAMGKFTYGGIYKKVSAVGKKYLKENEVAEHTVDLTLGTDLFNVLVRALRVEYDAYTPGNKDDRVAMFKCARRRHRVLNRLEANKDYLTKLCLLTNATSEPRSVMVALRGLSALNGGAKAGEGADKMDCSLTIR
ncbi:MAG: hypothetical protein COB66_03385 [Coxiella sp. (in: Bacteria)]|nr:MAG: hypothetical protein COB66_03385 [Coxiella sp. (in: g-proteobacteria)]